MTRKIEHSNHPPPRGYELWMSVVDTLGRRWRFCAVPAGSGSLAYFNRLSDYLRWCRQVEDVRIMASGGVTRLERLAAVIHSGDIDPVVGQRLAADWGVTANSNAEGGGSR